MFKFILTIVILSRPTSNLNISRNNTNVKSSSEYFLDISNNSNSLEIINDNKKANENNARPQFSFYMVGGSPASNFYPFMVSLRQMSNFDHFCGGSIVSNKHILTAAHCFCAGRYFKLPEDIIISAGTTNLNDPDAVLYSVHQTICHPEYHSEFQFHDIALAVSSRPFQFSDQINKIEMMSYKPNQDILPVQILGWGSTTLNGDAVADLQYINLKTISLQKCWQSLIDSELSEYLKEWNICTYHPIRRGCTRDSGGPVVYSNFLLGVVSWSANCNNDSPDVHTSVAHHYRWILEQIVRLQNTYLRRRHKF